MSGTTGDITGPARSKAESKADATDHAARAIIGAEARSREAKTRRLRQARLEREAARMEAGAATNAGVETPRRKRGR